jgi:hypothetical protein
VADASGWFAPHEGIFLIHFLFANGLPRIVLTVVNTLVVAGMHFPDVVKRSEISV